MIHIAAVTQLRLDTEGRAYYRRKRAEDKKPMEAMRCLKRRISDAIYRQLVADAQQVALASSIEAAGAGPGGHCGATQEASAVDLPPHIDTSDQPLPGPARPTLPATTAHAKPHAASAPRPPRRRQALAHTPSAETALLTTEASRNGRTAGQQFRSGNPSRERRTSPCAPAPGRPIRPARLRLRQWHPQRGNRPCARGGAVATRPCLRGDLGARRSPNTSTPSNKTTSQPLLAQATANDDD
jgi:hypothetical protein